MEEQPDARLVEQTLLDNKEAFTVLVERYQLMSLCIVKRYVANEEVARELVQEALLQAYLSLHQLRDGTRFKNWFYGITLNICRNWLRQQKNSAVLYAMAQEVDQALSSDPEEVLVEQELRHIVSEAIAILTPGNREVAQLFYYEDLGLQEIARQKNLSRAAVKNRLYKSREQLRVYLQTQYPELATRMVRANRRRKTTMIPMTVAKVHDSDKLKLPFTLVVLVDEQKARAIPFRYQNQLECGPYGPVRKNAVAEPLTMDFIVNIIQGLGGTIEEIEIDTLQEEIIYARLRLRGRKGERSTINTRLDDVLPMAIRLNAPILIAEELMERSGISLAETGESREQLLEAIMTMKRHIPPGMHALPPVISTKPRNLDFTQGLAGWRTMRDMPIDIQLDPQTLYRGQQSLRIKFCDDFSFPNALRRSLLMLQHEGFLADEYRGKRVRMVAYCKASGVKSAHFSLSSKGHWAETSPIEGTGNWQRREVVMEIPEDAKGISISFYMHGEGSVVWVSGMQFDIVDESVPLSHFEISRPWPSQLQNMDFQQGLQHWKISSSTPQDYDYGVERESNKQCTHSAYIKALKEEPRSPLTLQQFVKANDYAGRRIRLSGRLRASGVAEQANLYVSIKEMSLNKRRVERSIEGTKDWMSYEMTLLIPDDVYSLELGLTLHGRGQVWLQGVALAVVEDQP